MAAKNETKNMKSASKEDRVSSLAFCKESVNKVSNADMVCCTSDMDCTYLR